MSGPITAKYRLVTKLFGAYHAEIKRLLFKPRTNANESDDASLIGSYDYNGLLKPARDSLAAHIARKDNPHQETMATYGSYTAAQINSVFGGKVPVAVVPVSTYGIVDELTDAQVNAGWSGSGWILSVNREFQTVLSGTVYRLPPQQLSLLTVDSAPQNKTFYVYVRAQFGYVSYEARTDSPPESASVMYIGTVVTGPNGIVSTQFASVTRIETFRLSTSPVGSAIPVTSGNYDSPQKLPPSWNP